MTEDEVKKEGKERKWERKEPYPKEKIFFWEKKNVDNQMEVPKLKILIIKIKNEVKAQIRYC